MVSCLKCGYELPRDCKCEISADERISMYIFQASREAKLIAALRKAVVPKILLGSRLIMGSVSKVDNYCFRVNVSFTPEDWRKVRTITLLDLDDQPLYRVIKENMNLQGRKGDTLDLHWELGIGIKGE